jgi:hypothetical protein
MIWIFFGNLDFYVLMRWENIRLAGNYLNQVSIGANAIMELKNAEVKQILYIKIKIGPTDGWNAILVDALQFFNKIPECDFLLLNLEG